MKNKNILVVVVFLVLGCVKAKDLPKNPDNPTPPITTTYQQKLADTLFQIAHQVYYWNTQLPDKSLFNPSTYTSNDTLSGLSNELLALTRSTKNPDNQNKPYEQAISYNSQGIPFDNNSKSKFSFIVKTSDLTNSGSSLSAMSQDEKKIAEMKMTLDGRNNDLGFTVGVVRVNKSAGTTVSIPYVNKDSFVLYVRYVTNGSPANKAGLVRGDVIANKELDYNTKPGAISNALNSNSVNLIVYKPAIKKYDTLSTISKMVYSFNPVLRDTVITVGNKVIAYLAYESFTAIENSKPALENSFAKFTNATDLVVDLRHNGGGYSNTAEYLINLMAPQSANGKVSFVEHYNQMMANKQATILKTQPVFLNNIKQSYSYFDIDYSVAGNTLKVNKTGLFNASNNISNIYFIVSSSTASAAELLINSLKPYCNVYLIGASFSDFGTKTYGKPVGFFELRLGKYSMFLVSFETKNAQGIGGYYDGMSTNEQAFDDVKYNFGDPNESCFKLAIQKITGNPNYNPSSIGRSVYSGRGEGIAIGRVAKISDLVSTPKKLNHSF